MVPLIDGELEQVDKKHNELMSLNKKLIDSFQMYTKLMAESAAVPQYSAPSSYMAPSTQPAAAMTNHMLPQMTSQQPAYQSLPAAGSYVPDPSTAQVNTDSLIFVRVIICVQQCTASIAACTALLQLWRLQWTGNGGGADAYRTREI